MKTLKANIFILFCTFLVSSCKKEVPAPLPIADFYVENSSCISDCYLKVYDQSNNAVKWNWDFGNGLNSLVKNDSALFINPGIYQVKLTVWNQDDVSDDITKTITIN